MMMRCSWHKGHRVPALCTWSQYGVLQRSKLVLCDLNISKSIDTHISLSVDEQDISID